MQQHTAKMDVSVNIIDIVASIGLTVIVTQSFLFDPVRQFLLKKNKYLGKLFHCPMCFGFWSIFIVLFFKSFIPIINYGFITSLFCYIVYLLIKPLMDKYD